MSGFDPNEVLNPLWEKVFGIQGLNNDHSNNIILYKSILHHGSSNHTSSLEKNVAKLNL